MGGGYRQTIENGKVVNVISIPVEEAQREYYKSRSPEMQAFDTQQEEIAAKTNQYLKEKQNAI